MDAGHNYILEELGLIKRGGLLSAYGHRLAGIHLHNVKKLVDHQAPCDGDMDLRIFKPYIKPQTIKVIEVHRHVSPEAIKNSMKYLVDIFGE